MPAVTYTSPEVASVGQTEEQLKASGVEYKAGTFAFAANSRTRCNGDTRGLTKLLADAKTDRLLGAHIIGPDAGTVIREAVLAWNMAGPLRSSADDARPSHFAGGTEGGGSRLAGARYAHLMWRGTVPTTQSKAVEALEVALAREWV